MPAAVSGKAVELTETDSISYRGGSCQIRLPPLSKMMVTICAIWERAPWRAFTWDGVTEEMRGIGLDTRPIGVFDSGLGGLTAVRELCRRPDMAQAIANLNPEGMSPNKQMVANLVRKRHFFTLTQLYRLKNRI